jgi:hypothetical protein
MGLPTTERLLFPSPAMTHVPPPPPIGEGVYYTPATHFPLARGPYYSHFSHDDTDDVPIKHRTMSAEVRHRSSFCAPPEKARAESFGYVSEEMLRSAMPERYDD